MKILLVSDNHGDEAIIEDLIAIYQDDVDYMVHLGDSESPDDHTCWKHMIPIKGNNDWGPGYIEETVVHLAGMKLFASHGHLYQVNDSLGPLSLKAAEKGCQLAAYGHTHRPRVEKVNGVLTINPGSISRPRGPIQDKLYAILQLDGKAYQLDYYTDNHRLYEPLSCSGVL